MTFSNVLLAICLLTVINLKPIATSNSTKCHRLCVCLDSMTIDCSNKNLTALPNDLPIYTKILLFKNNQIENLTSAVFSALSNLTKVDLSGNNINCGCGLAWSKNASFSVQLMATCQSPARVKGRPLADVTKEDMCKSPSTTPAVAKASVHRTVQVPITTASQLKNTTAMASTSNTENAVTSSGVPTAINKSQTTRDTLQTTTAEPPTTTAEPQATIAGPQASTKKHLTTDSTKMQTTTEDSVPSTPHPPNVTSATTPTRVMNGIGPSNLTKLVEMSDSEELTPESLRNLIKSLEDEVDGRNTGDTKNILLISSNMLKEYNRKSWSTVNENFPGGEKLLNVVNEAMRRHAIGMLNSTKNHSQHIFFNNSNLVAEIQIVIAEEMADKDIQFPVSKSPEDDYIQISGSSFKKAGKEKVAVIGMKSARLGELLPQRSMIDGFDSFHTGSGLLSASVLSLKEKFSSPVEIIFRNKLFLGDDEELTKCAFWKYENTGKSETSGSDESGWSDKGCQVFSRNRSTTICHCDHTTDFSVLTQSIVVIPKHTILMYIAGLCLVIGAAIACIRDIFVWRQTRHERLSVLIHECLAFILTGVVFLLGLFFDYHQVMCMIFSALLQWFVVAVFCWILTEFLQLYLCTHFGWNRSKSRLKYFAILGWVFPLILVGITLAITRQDHYGSEQWCWYSNSKILLLTYICPIVLCILLSILFILKIGCFKSDATDDSEKKDISVVMALSGFLIPLVLCVFTTASLSADRPEEKVFQYLCVVFCALFAVYIVIYHCWLDREIMKLSVKKNDERTRPKRDYYSTKETVMYSEDTSEGKKFSLIFPSRKSPKSRKLCLVIGAAIACIRDIFVWRQTRHERLSVLIHECLAFILTGVVFLLGLFFDYHQVMCMIFSALLQWFVVAVFCWILTEFLQLYLCTHFGWNRSKSRLKYFAILGWVFPLILVGITLAITRQDHYGSEQWCWYSNSKILLLTYICPIVLCILLSILFILKIGCFKSDATDDSEKKDISVVMALSGFLIPLVLCVFTTASLSADRPEEKVFQYLCVVFCALFAVYIVIYHCWLDREIMKLSVKKNDERTRPKRDYYSTKETVMYSEDTSEGKKFSLIFPSRKSPKKKPKVKKDERNPAKRSDSSSPFDYNSTVPLYPSINDASLRSFKSQVSTQQHTLDTPPNTLSAITISRPNSQCIELTSLSDLDRRPDGAEQTDAGEHGEFYGIRHSNPLDKERQRTSGCSTDCTNATTFGKEKVVQKPSDAPSNEGESKNRISGTSSAGLSRTSRSSVSGASLTAAVEENVDDSDTFETQPFIRQESPELGPEIRSDPPAKIPKRRKRSSRRRLDDDFHDDEKHEPKIKTRQGSSTLPSTEGSVKLKQYTSF